MPDPISLAIVFAFIGKNASSWLEAVQSVLLNKGKDALFDKGKDAAVAKVSGYRRRLFHLDEKEQRRHLELALKNAAERGLVKFHTLQEHDQYCEILTILFEPGAHSDTLRREALRLFSISDTPNLAELNEVYNRSLRMRSLSQPTPPTEIDASPYLASFFDALITELYSDPFFRQQMSDVLKVHAATNIQRSLEEIVTTLRLIGKTLTDNYTPEEFEHDVKTYADHIERVFHHLKIVGIVPKDRGGKNADPEINGIFVPLRIALQGHNPMLSEKEQKDSIVASLERHPYIVLLGGPGSGKSTAIRYLAWSHAMANQADASAADIPLLSGNPLPLRIELRRLTEDRRHHPGYSFLTYATEVLLGRNDITINPQMFRELLERRAMLLLLDGLDEVATLDERRQLVEEIEHFAMCYPGNRIVVTSRPVGYELARFSEEWFAHTQVQEFNDEQIRQFLERWYTHMLRLSPIPHDDQQELEALFTTLKENQRLHKLAENPLLLTVITALHRYERLPDRRVQAYDKCAELLLQNWAKLRGTDMRWRDMRMVSNDQYACVAHLGFVLHERSQEQENKDIASDVSAKFLSREIEKFLSSLISEVAERRAEAKRFLDLMQIEAGLIVERGTDETGEPLYGFVHRTFQEYFAAVDCHLCYQQEESPKIISDFLQEHLHDPHWHEVTLLLLGKLPSKPATRQLSLILESTSDKPFSQRSKYTDIVQQDLFFVSSCLSEEITVENNLAEAVVMRLSNVVKNSLIPSQRAEALGTLGKLMQTRQYSIRAQRALATFVNQNDSLHTPIRVKAAQTLFQCSAVGSPDRQMALQVISQFACYPTLSVRQIVNAAIILHQSPIEEEQQVASQVLFLLIQCSDLPIQEIIEVASEFNPFDIEAEIEEHIRRIILVELVKRSDLSMEEMGEAARILYLNSTRGTKEEHIGREILLELVKRPDLSIEEAIKVAQAIYIYSKKEENERNAGREKLIQIMSIPCIPIEYTIEISEILYMYTRDEIEYKQVAIAKLLELIAQTTFSIEDIIKLAESLYRFSKEGMREKQIATAKLLELAIRPDLSIEEIIKAHGALYRCSKKGTKERQIAMTKLSELIVSPALSIENIIKAFETLYLLNDEIAEETTIVVARLLELTRQGDLLIENVIKAFEAIYQFSANVSEEGKYAIQKLFQIAEDGCLTAKLRLQATAAVLKYHLRN